MLDESKYDLEYFRDLVKRTDSTYGELAMFLGVGERTFYRWMSGESRIPKAAYIVLELLLERQ